MNQPAVNLFGEKRITIDGNPKLAGIANHIIQLYERDKSLLDGKTVGEINRKVTLAVYMDNGLRQAVGSVESFSDWFLNAKCPTEEEVARALRYLAERDFVRLPKVAIERAEQHRQRIARSVKA